MKKIISGVLFAFLMMISISGLAQDQEQEEEMFKAKKMEGHTWHQVVMVKFKPGSIDKAKNFIDDYFMKAGIESEISGPQMIEFKTGEWDMMFVWTMEEGIADLDWEIHPNDEKWWTAMVKQAGSQEKAMEIMQSYMDLIDNSTSYLATSRQEMSDQSMGSNNKL